MPHRDENIFGGLRITNFGWFWVATIMGQIFADLGAEVVKVESRVSFDNARATTIGLAGSQGEGLFTINVQHSLKSIQLNLSAARGVEIAKELVRQSDVVIENYRPGVMERLGLSYADLRKIRPDIIMVSASAYGQHGPLRTASGFGTNLACVTGMDTLQGYDKSEPRPFNIAILDPMNGVLGAYAALAALRHRERTGRGQYIDIAQAEAAINMFGAPLLDAVFNGRIHHAIANRDLAQAPHNLYRCKGEDAWVGIAIATEDEWRRFCDATEHPSWADDPRFADGYLRLRNQDELDVSITEWTRERDPAEIVELLQAHGIASGPVRNIPQVAGDPHYADRQSWMEAHHPFGNAVLYTVPWKMSATQPRVRRPGPLFGMDTQRYLQDVLGIPEAETDRLVEQKVLY
ncbi:MAG: CoA transferase [Chloroflexi bacterium]|nr:CoA transferase [Chloroflexota bacterium]